MSLKDKVQASGIVGAGGAGFPSHVKLSSKADIVILNGAECEPLLCVDIQLLSKYLDEILSGLNEVVKSIDAQIGYIAVKRKHKEVIESIKVGITKYSKMELFTLNDFYPAGDEQILVHEVTGRVVPEGGIPLKVNCIVLNVETVLNIFNSINGINVTQKFLTVAGEVPNPITIKVPVGTSIREVLSIAGIKETNGLAVIDGGPMMGKLLLDIDSPVIKTTKGLIVLKEDHFLVSKKKLDGAKALKQSKAACIQCRMCTDLCPRYLIGHNMQPHLMMRLSQYDVGNVEAAGISELCSQCNVCELYACPVGLSPRLINIHYKQKRKENGLKYKSDKEVYTPSNLRDYRKIPIGRLISRLGLKAYNIKAPILDMEFQSDTVRIPLLQHIGAPSIPVVTLGQIVKSGDLIGRIPDNSLGAMVHASIDGEITEINNSFIEIKKDRRC